MYKVRIEQFEGPFDLLVYLIENARMDIYDIRVAEITEQYIDYLKEMEELSIEVGSEFIVLAAVLIRLKSRMLLPRADADGELQIEEDPRAELVSRLQDYMRTKKIAEMLQEREEYCLNIHAKPGEDISRYLEAPDELLRTDSDQCVRAFLAFLEKRKRLADVRKRYERVRRERSSVEDRIRQMTSILNRKLARGGKVLFTELIPEQADRYDVTLSFLSLLEMIKAQEVDAKQQQLYGEIEVTKHGQGGNNG
ncbi:MAG: segregation/condensation protein A [Mogibacterium sp.]|nr:segregation/condensation protein A [Mogibacterium sp.]